MKITNQITDSIIHLVLHYPEVCNDKFYQWR